MISGNGQTIVFERSTTPSLTSILKIFWTGAGLALVASGAESPSINDDAKFIYYATIGGGTRQIRVMGPGGAVTQLTSTSFSNYGPAVSGGNNRVAFSIAGGAYPGGTNPDGGSELLVMDASGANIRQLTANGWGAVPIDPDLSLDGSRAIFSLNNAGGVGPTGFEIYKVQADGSGLSEVTSGLVPAGDQTNGAISADGETILFQSTLDLGQNPCGNEQIFRVQADGSALAQVSPAGNCGGNVQPALAAIDDRVVFQCAIDCGDPDGTGAELYGTALDGSGMGQVTDDDDTFFKNPRASADGQWVVFHSSTNFDGANPTDRFEVLRARTDGTVMERVTDPPPEVEHISYRPDLSGDGSRIVYISLADPLGTNPDHNAEIFLYEPATDTRRQLTVSAVGGSWDPRISSNGAWVYFFSSAPLVEGTPDHLIDFYRVSADTGIIERAGGLPDPRSRLTFQDFLRRNVNLAVDADGDRAVFLGAGDATDENADFSSELWLVDFSTPAAIRASKTTPTVVSWEPEPGPRHYDVIRGDVASLALGAGNTVDLGAVVCLEDDSPDAHTVGDEDLVEPSPGQAFFFVYRGSQGAGPGSWGQGTGGRERVAGTGSCAP
jgi:Tol biopolymer transport system component